MSVGRTVRHKMQTRIVMTCAICALLWATAPQDAVAGAMISQGASSRLLSDYRVLAQATAPDTPQPAAPSAPEAPSPPPQTQSTPQAPPKPTAAGNGTPAVVLDGQQVESILGKKVRSAGGDDMGRIVDIIGDKSGQVRAAIIDFGGFLGVGSRQIAVDWKALRFPMDGKSDAVVVDLSRDQLRGEPAYKAGEQIVVLGRTATNDPQASITAPPVPETAESAKPAPSK